MAEFGHTNLLQPLPQCQPVTQRELAKLSEVDTRYTQFFQTAPSLHRDWRLRRRAAASCRRQLRTTGFDSLR